MPSFNHISTPFTEHWVAWVMLLLLVLLAAAEFFQPSRFARAFRSLPTTKERDSIFMGSGTDYRSRIMLILFEVGVLMLFLLWWLNGAFDALHMLIALGCALGAMLIKWAVQAWIEFTFFPGKELEVFIRHYFYLKDCALTLVFVVLMPALFGHLTHNAGVVLMLTIGVIYLLLLVYKVIALFRLTPSLLLFLPLYILTVELIPVFGMIFATQQLTNNILI